ncbi:MAG: chromate transporter [Candidatus Shapirobacteria bacterium]
MEIWLKKLDNFFNDLFLKKAPQLSIKFRQGIVKYLAWIILFFVVLSIPGIFSSLISGLIPSSLAGIVFFLLGASQVVLEAIALPGLFSKTRKGWQLLYYSGLVGIFASLFSLSLFSLIFTGVGLYFLYQIRSCYVIN